MASEFALNTTSILVVGIIFSIPTIVQLHKLIPFVEYKMIEEIERLSMQSLFLLKYQKREGKKLWIIFASTPKPLCKAPPAEQVKILISKSAPLRYYDIAGTSHDKISPDTLTQEGRRFEYINQDYSKPNNINKYIGFNEIYGTLSLSHFDAKPPLRIPVKMNRFYNIFVETGQFSSCLRCGRDYYSALNRLFPDAFEYPGGGLSPDLFRTERSKRSSHINQLRSDDLLFGRACFVPATMIPWSHVPKRNRESQRKNRLQTQHFFYANGFQRDWFGFDYGSVIGSFDGTHWFSIGHQRQIKATSNRLYVAINAPFIDLSPKNQYTVRVSESLGSLSNISIPKSDSESSGAQCQKFHQCTKDQDCITQLGWEYACENIEQLKTPWPVFDENSKERPDSSRMISLLNLVGTSPGVSNKRCVYRGRGALCHPNYAPNSSPAENSRYAKIKLARINGCSANHWCADVTQHSVFNEKTNRFALSPSEQNADPEFLRSLKGHTFGLGARIIARPFEYQGSLPLLPQLKKSFQKNNIQGLCIPGKSTSEGDVSYQNQHASPPTSHLDDGDIVGNIGMTEALPGETGSSASFYNSCPTLDERGQLYHFENPTALPQSTQQDEIGPLSSQQNLSSSLLSPFVKNASRSPYSNLNRLLSSFNSTVEKPTLQKNRCLRAAGSACFTDLDCAPSFIGDSLLSFIDPELDQTTFSLNGYEIQYWKETLTCSQRAEKYSLNFDLRKNICCREKELTLTIGNNDPNSSSGRIETRRIAGYNDSQEGGIDLDAQNRNTRSHIIFASRLKNPNDFPIMSVGANDNPRNSNEQHPLKQYLSFSSIAEKTCCTGHWVREFHEDNGAGHYWHPNKMQSIDKTNFACLNYQFPSTSTVTLQQCLNNTSACDCSDPNNANCYIRSLLLSEAARYNKFFSTLELLGIPQVLIQSNASQYITDQDFISCIARPNEPIPETLNSSHNPQTQSEYEDPPGSNSGRFYYKASDKDNFSSSLKKIFSEDKVSCCLPPGSIVSENTTEKSCCSGNIAQVAGGQQLCCLQDYTNLTVFL